MITFVTCPACQRRVRVDNVKRIIPSHAPLMKIPGQRSRRTCPMSKTEWRKP